MIIQFLEKDVGMLEMDKTAATRNTLTGLLFQIICNRCAQLIDIFDIFRDEHKKNDTTVQLLELLTSGGYMSSLLACNVSCVGLHWVCVFNHYPA